MDTAPRTPSGRTAAEFKQWSKDHKPLAMAVCRAMAFAEVEQQRVDAYVRPIFDSFNFVDEHEKKIEHPKDVYLSQDEAACKAFFARCDEAHRAHGFKGPEGHCPALEAETVLRIAEDALLRAGADFLEIEELHIYGEDRKKMLDLLLGACINA